MEILKRIIELEGADMLFVDSSIKLSQFYGIEIDDFAHEVAILSMWLAEHQMNQYFEDQLEGYTEYQSIIPLKKSGHIVQGNAARMSWQSVCPVDDEQETYVIGNPPFLGSRNQDKEQKEDMKHVFRTKYKSLDYVSIWFYKGAKYIEGKNAQLAFVSTNSVTQGLLVSITWPRILNENIEIGFAYQSFKWTNNAKRNAGVTVIILSLRNKSNKPKYLFTDEIQKNAKHINAYLLDNPDIYILAKSSPLSNFPQMLFGNMPNDGGNLLFNENEYKKFVEDFPEAKKFIKTYIGGADFINGRKRYTLFVDDKDIEKAKEIPEIAERFQLVYEHRINSTEKSTRDKAATPNQFYFSGHKNTDSIIVPRTTSERRDYIPIGFLTAETIISDSAMAIYDAQPWLFGIIHSRMHMVWVRAVGGKLKTDYRYSARLCYNTFPFPNISIKQKETLNQYVYDILDEREKHPEKTMAQLYDPDKMPTGLRLAHQALDKAVEQCYRLQEFKTDSDRLEYLFRLYEEMTKTN